MPIVISHEHHTKRGGCEFDRFFATTPPDLIAIGLYKKLAIACYEADEDRRGSMAMVRTPRVKFCSVDPAARIPRLEPCVPQLAFRSVDPTARIPRLKSCRWHSTDRIPQLGSHSWHSTAWIPWLASRSLDPVAWIPQLGSRCTRIPIWQVAKLGLGFEATYGARVQRMGSLLSFSRKRLQLGSDPSQSKLQVTSSMHVQMCRCACTSTPCGSRGCGAIHGPLLTMATWLWRSLLWHYLLWHYLLWHYSRGASARVVERCHTFLGERAGALRRQRQRQGGPSQLLLSWRCCGGAGCRPF